MTLQQSLQADTKKTRELFDKLEETSDQAVKTRENLFGELSRELRLHAEVEERDLFPALRRNEETRELVDEAAKRTRELKAKLDELDALAKGDPSFRERLAELRKLHQQQLRDERAGAKALDDEQQQAVEGKIEKRRSQAEEQRQAEDDERKAEARREAEHARAATARKRAAEQVGDAAKQTARDLQKSAAEAVRDGRDAAREGAELVREGAETVRESAENARGRVIDTARRVRDAASDTVVSYRDTAGEGIEDLKTIGSAVRNFARVGRELRSVVVTSIRQSSVARFEHARDVLRDPLRYGELRRDYTRTRSRNRAELAAELLQIVRSASTAARQPFEQRLRAVA